MWRLSNITLKIAFNGRLQQVIAGNSTGTVEQMDANVEAMERDLKEILRIGAEQKRLWEVYSK